MIHRLVKPLKSRSFFLFGARGTGKTTFVHQQFLRDCPSNKLLTLDLLDYSTYEKFRKHPELLEEINFNKLEWVLIDEVQRIPALLNHIHRICEKKIKTKFILTGSSSRKLKREGANLLAGRAFYQSLFPFTSFELAANFNLEKSLNFGLLPEVFNFQSQDEIIAYLQTYVRIYIKEEILVEQLVRKIDPFRNFLEITAQMNAAPLNFSKIAKEIGVDTKTVQEYFSILVDTWLGIYLPSYHKSVRKSQVVAPKFYLFDPGVKRGLEGTLKQELTLNSFAYGHAFE
ncbi:MAG: AAA family ATPase, partial [Pseudomonadota bacterium]